MRSLMVRPWNSSRAGRPKRGLNGVFAGTEGSEDEGHDGDDLQVPQKGAGARAHEIWHVLSVADA